MTPTIFDHHIVHQSLLIFCFGLVCAAMLTYLVKLHANHLGLISAPNHRSSHINPTPRGGGVGIVGGMLSAYALSNSIVAVSSKMHVCFGLSIVIATLGLLDDRFGLRSTTRLVVQLTCIGLLLWTLGNTMPLPTLSFFTGLIRNSPALYAFNFALLLLFGVWWLNLYNFMDGIDGIAGSQAVFMTLVMLALLTFAGVHSQTLPIPADILLTFLGLLGSTLAFLFYNWPPAKIFMGDVGSTFLGFMMLLLAIVSTQYGLISLEAWLMLGASFICDATVTLCNRVRLGHSPTEAHRSHLYQRLSRKYGNHQTVTLLYTLVNCFWILPLAMLTQFHSSLWLLLGYAPLLYVAHLLGAGQTNDV